MAEKLEGQIVYLTEEEVEDFVFNLNELSSYGYQSIQGAVVAAHSETGIKTVIFDVVGTSEYWDSYVKGFLYDDGKFLGHFYYISDSKKPKESMTGKYASIAGGYEIKGIIYEDGNFPLDFYLQIKTQALKIPMSIKKEKFPKITTIKKLEDKTPKREVIDTYPSILNADLLKGITIKSDKKKKALARKGYLMYDHVIKWKPSAESGDDLIIAMCIAYSWMPTMLDIYVNDKKELNGLLKPVKELGNIKTLEDFDKQTNMIEACLTKLSKAIKVK